jgi:protease I
MTGWSFPAGTPRTTCADIQSMVSLVKGFADAGKLVAAICHAGWMLVSADIVRGRTVTSYFSIKDDLVNAGGNWVDEGGGGGTGGLVTSRTPDDLPAFMRAIIGVLGGGDRP